MHFFTLLSTLPLIGITVTSGFFLFICTALLKLLVPTREFFGSCSSFILDFPINTSFGLSRFSIDAITKSPSSSVGISLILWTAKSALSSRTALSTSFSKIPFSLTENRNLFLLISPIDFILIISQFIDGNMLRKLRLVISVCINASLLPRVATLKLSFNLFHFFQCLGKRFHCFVYIVIIMRIGNKTGFKL